MLDGKANYWAIKNGSQPREAITEQEVDKSHLERDRAMEAVCEAAKKYQIAVAEFHRVANSESTTWSDDMAKAHIARDSAEDALFVALKGEEAKGE